jgi:ABC-type polysaccharide/polyol phosphate export permease
MYSVLTKRFTLLVGSERQHKIRTSIDLVLLLVQRDLRIRYRGSLLGYIWSMMNPLLTMLILWAVFSHLMKFQIPNFPIFLLSGILTWNFFLQSMSIGVNSILHSGGLLKKVKTPAFIFPLATVASCLVNFFLALVPFAIISVLIGHHVDFEILLLPLVWLPYIVFTFGCALALSSLNVIYRDVSHVIDPILAITFYATPVIYPNEAIPEKYRQIFELNPMNHFVSASRSLLYESNVPSAKTFAILGITSLLAFLIGLSIYRAKRGKFIYYV